MQTQTLDVQINRGCDLRLSLTYKDATGALIDLAGATGICKFQFETLLTATVTITNPGGIAIVLPASLTTGQTVGDVGEWDLVVTQNGSTIYVIGGHASIVKTISL